MTGKVKYSNSYHAKRKRIQRLPELVQNSLIGKLKSDADNFIKMFHDGIKGEEFTLTGLADSTVTSKIYQGFSQPDTPLYGAGDSQKNSYTFTGSS